MTTSFQGEIFNDHTLVFWIFLGVVFSWLWKIYCMVLGVMSGIVGDNLNQLSTNESNDRIRQNRFAVTINQISEFWLDAHDSCKLKWWIVITALIAIIIG